MVSSLLILSFCAGEEGDGNEKIQKIETIISVDTSDRCWKLRDGTLFRFWAKRFTVSHKLKACAFLFSYMQCTVPMFTHKILLVSNLHVNRDFGFDAHSEYSQQWQKYCPNERTTPTKKKKTEKFW